MELFCVFVFEIRSRNAGFTEVFEKKSESEVRERETMNLAVVAYMKQKGTVFDNVWVEICTKVPCVI